MALQGYAMTVVLFLPLENFYDHTHLGRNVFETYYLFYSWIYLPAMGCRLLDRDFGAILKTHKTTSLVYNTSWSKP